MIGNLNNQLIPLTMKTILMLCCSLSLVVSLQAQNPFTPDSNIFTMMNQVDTILLRQTVQHLQDYGTRYAYMPQADSAGEWIYQKLDSISNLSVVKQYFPFPNGDTGFNVIATHTGTLYPDEYVVIGGHYDSQSVDNMHAPGANDDAVGTAGVMEAARILSQYTFDRSILFACWNMEEPNLGGSGYFALDAANHNMKILGYFNLDCGGYLKPGNQPLTFIVHQPGSDYLADFYMETCSTYLPSLLMTPVQNNLSDEFEFSLNGFQSLWNMEDLNNASIYNHTPQDKIGINVNSFYNLATFVKADIANLARMADLEPRPLNLRGSPEDGKIKLTWNPNENVDHYNIYRDSVLIAGCNDTIYTDINVTNGSKYSYFITSVWSNPAHESDGSSPVSLKPRPAMVFPFSDFFENGAWYWDLDPPWGTENKGINQSMCLSDSPGGQYTTLSSPVAYLASLDLTNCSDAQVSFMTQYTIGSLGDVAVLIVNYNSYYVLDEFQFTQPTWIQKTYSLNDFLGKSGVHLFFLLFSDKAANMDGIYIDDFTLSLTTGAPEDRIAAKSESIKFVPNPFTDHTMIEYVVADNTFITLIIYDTFGKEVGVLVNGIQTKGRHQVQWDAGDLPAGVYFCRVQAGKKAWSGKVVKN
jgi:hypothetical protein